MQVARGIPALLAIVVASGCAVGSSATPADDARALSEPVAQATSAVQTATVAVGLLDGDRLTAPVTDTALVDQIHVLEDAADAVSTLVPAGPDAAGWQEDALAAVRDAQAAVVSARGWVEQGRRVGGGRARGARRERGPARRADHHARRGGCLVKKVLGLALGILTAIGGFLDIGDLVTNAVVGSRFGLSLAWVVVVGVVGICLFAQMSGRVAAVSGRATFEIIRERLGPRAAGANLGGVVPHQPADADRGGRRHRARPAAGQQRRAAALDPGRRAGRLAGDLADEVLDHGERHRPGRPDPRRLRRRGVPARPGLGHARRPGVPPERPGAARAMPSTGTTRSPCSAPR